MGLSFSCITLDNQFRSSDAIPLLIHRLFKDPPLKRKRDFAGEIAAWHHDPCNPDICSLSRPKTDGRERLDTSNDLLSFGENIIYFDADLTTLHPRFVLFDLSSLPLGIHPLQLLTSPHHTLIRPLPKSNLTSRTS